MKGTLQFRAAATIAALLTLAPALVAPAVAWAQTTPSRPMMQGMAAGGMSGADVVSGEVRKIDRGAGKITLRHAEMPHLDMPAMTMVFRVQDPALLDTVKVGDKVVFKAQKMGGAFVVVELQPGS